MRLQREKTKPRGLSHKCCASCPARGSEGSRAWVAVAGRAWGRAFGVWTPLLPVTNTLPLTVLALKRSGGETSEF